MSKRVLAVVAYSRGVPIREWGLFVKISFRGGGLFESGDLIDHLRYSNSRLNKKAHLFLYYYIISINNIGILIGQTQLLLRGA